MQNSILIPPDLSLLKQVPLAPYTTFKIGGPAEYLYEADSIDGLKKALAWAKTKNLRVTILGGGSNVLVADEGIPGLVIVMKLKGIEVILNDDEVFITAAAGEVWDELVAYCVNKGWWGIENLSSIPGSVGAFPVQNVGAYGVSAEDVVVSVTAMHKETQTEKFFSKDDCRFSYRESFFKSAMGKEYVVTSVTLRLHTKAHPLLAYKDIKEYFETNNQEPTLANIRSAVCTIRKRKFPDLKTYGTAGSFFKNPVVSMSLKQSIEAKYPTLVTYPIDEHSVKLSAAWLIDNILGLRGAREGSVGTYEGQALVVVNYSDANAHEVINFTKKIQEQLYKKIGVILEQETQIIF